MNTHIDHDPWLRAQRQSPEKSGRPCGLDWQGLAARFAAIHAYNRAIALPLGGEQGAHGSFDPATAHQLALYDTYARLGARVGHDPAADAAQNSSAVNPITLADGKAAAVIGSSVAGLNSSGTRGLK